ncbi:MAG: response regulator [bacterium]|nr:response regulator [bacterium]
MPNQNEKKMKILLAEDDTFLAGIYAAKFEQAGFTVVLAADGEAGLKAAQKELPDIILLDILMPKMDGFEVLENLKKNDKTKSIPVILLTNLGQREDVDKGLKLGAVDYLIKAHFMPHETVEKVKKVIAATAK